MREPASLFEGDPRSEEVTVSCGLSRDLMCFMIRVNVFELCGAGLNKTKAREIAKRSRRAMTKDAT